MNELLILPALVLLVAVVVVFIKTIDRVRDVPSRIRKYLKELRDRGGCEKALQYFDYIFKHRDVLHAMSENLNERDIHEMAMGSLLISFRRAKSEEQNALRAYLPAGLPFGDDGNLGYEFVVARLKAKVDQIFEDLRILEEERGIEIKLVNSLPIPQYA